MDDRVGTVRIEVTGLSEVKGLFDELERHLDATCDVIERMEDIELGVKGHPGQEGAIA